MMNYKLASFDLDGTLSVGISTGQHLAKKIGHFDKMAELERKYECGEISNTDVAILDATFYQGLSSNDINTYLEDLPVLSDISQTVNRLSKNGIRSVLCTIAWSDVAKAISNRYGLVKWSGPVLELGPTLKYTGKVSSHFESEDKVKFISNICNEIGISLSEVFHVGDSRSDIELFQEVGFSIALNATEQAKNIASASIDTDSLLDIFTVLPS